MDTVLVPHNAREKAVILPRAGFYPMRQNNRMDIQEFLRRYDQALADRGMSNRKACELAGVSEDTTRNPRRKGTRPDIVSTARLAHVLGLDPWYLLAPLGLTLDLLQGPASSRATDYVAKDDDERALLDAWRDIGEEDRGALRVALRNARAVSSRGAA